MMKSLVGLCAFLGAMASTAASAQNGKYLVESNLDVWETIQRAPNLNLGPRAHQSWPIQLQRGRGVRIVAEVAPNWVSPPTIAVCDAGAMQRFLGGDGLRSAGCVTKTMNAARDGLQFDSPVDVSAHVVIQNGRFARGATERNLAVTVERSLPFAESKYRNIPTWLSNIDEALSRDLKDFEFVWGVSSCGGQNNAFYSPSRKMIMLCTPMFEEQDRIGALNENATLFTVTHEVGHGLLHQWNLPGWNNEAMADELGAVLFFALRNQDVDQFVPAVQFWRSLIPLDEVRAERVSYFRSPHPPAVERARSLSTFGADPAAYVSRWYSVLEPHFRDNLVASHARGENPYVDSAMAQRVMLARAERPQRYADRNGVPAAREASSDAAIAAARAAASDDVRAWLDGFKDQAVADAIITRPFLAALVEDYFDAVGEPSAFRAAVNDDTPICMTACRDHGEPAVRLGADVTAADFVRMIAATKFGYVEEADRRWRALERIDAVVAAVGLENISLSNEDAAYFAGAFADIVATSEKASGRDYRNLDALIEKARAARR